jgi:hypothetical protein
MRQLEFLGKLMVGLRFLDRVQVGALDILDQRQFQQLLVCCVTDHHRHCFQPCLTCGLQTAFACDQCVGSIFTWRNYQRLDHAMLTNRSSKVFQLIRIEFFARLARVALDRFNRDLCDTTLPAGRLLTCGNEGIESFTEAGAWGHDCVSLFLNTKCTTKSFVSFGFK